jgi:hypothetical protein
MSTPYIIPFNFQPVNVVSASSGSYTVPSGKYAKVTVVLSSQMAFSSLSGTATAVTNTNIFSSESGHVVVDLYLKAGDVLSFSSSSGSGASVTTSGGNTSGSFVLSTSSSQSALVNSNTAAVARGYIGGFISVQGTANSAMGVNVGTNNGFSYTAQEYNVIS